MENFNLVNNLNNINITQTKANIVQNSQNQQTQNQAPQPQIQTPQQNQTINPSLMYDFQLAKMDNETVLKYLQNLMKLPNSIEKFVDQLGGKNADLKLASILTENLISIKALSEFLNQNSTDAISKLMQTISSTLKSGVSDVSQLKEILSVLGAIQTSTSLNANALKELLLIYIPLNAPVFDKNTDSEIANEDEKQAIKNSKLSILFETINFSNMLFCLNEAQNNILIDIFTAKNFPSAKFSSILNALSKEMNINLLTEFKTKEIQKTNSAQNFKVISDGFISPNVLLLSHLIIKTVLKIDEEFNYTT